MEAVEIYVLLADNIDGTLLCRYLRGGYPREVVGSVATVRGREVQVVWLDDGCVFDVSIVPEGSYKGEILRPLFYEHHVPQVAP